jgi:GDP-L-fucose synthase
MILLTGSSGLVGNCVNGDNIIRVTTKDADLRDFSQVCSLFERHPEITGVIHLAANVGGLFKNMREPVEMFEDNVMMNLNILRAAHKYNINKVLCCLSTCIFPDDPPKYPITSDMLHSGPPHESNEAYAYAKRVMEVQCRTYQKEYNREYFCVVPTNIYGPKDNFSLQNGHVIPSLINKCFLAKKAGTDFVVAGDGTPLRQFVFSEDLGKMIMKCYENPSKMPLVLCPPEAEYTIAHVAKTIAKAMKFTGNIVYDTSRPNGQHRKTAQSCDLLESYTSLEEGIQTTVDWFIDKNMFRQIKPDDYDNFLKLIMSFRPTYFTKEDFTSYISRMPQGKEIVVMEVDSKLVATVTVIYEEKLIFNISTTVHIEDVCVLPDERKKGYGSMILQKVMERARKKGCRKLTLSAADDVSPFYTVNGFEQRGSTYSFLLKDS